MAAWGRGLLQNDEAQDGMAGILRSVEDDVLRLVRRRPAEAHAARLAGEVGLLLQLQSAGSFDGKGSFKETLHAALERHRPCFPALPKKAASLLNEVLAGRGRELAERPGKLDPALRKAFFGDGKKSSPAQRGFGKREPVLFEHPESARAVQALVDRCVRWANSGFRRRSVANDLSREGGSCVASLAVLLVVEPARVDGNLFREWLHLYRAATAGLDELSAKYDFERAHGQYLEQALEYGSQKYAGKLLAAK